MFLQNFFSSLSRKRQRATRNSDHAKWKRRVSRVSHSAEMDLAELLANAERFPERQVAEFEALDAIYPDELTIATDDESAPPTLACTIALEPLAVVAGDKLQHSHPAVVFGFPRHYPEGEPPRVRTVGLAADAVVGALIEGCLEESQGEEAVMLVVMALNEHIQQQNDSAVATHATHAAAASQREQAQQDAASQHASIFEAAQEHAAATDQAGRKVVGRRIIYSHHISSPAKQKDIRKTATAMQLGGLCKVGKPGVVVIEGPEEQCRLFCPALVDLGWVHQKEVGEEQCEGEPGQSLDSLRRLPVAFEMLGDAKMSELTQRCRDAGLGVLFFAALGIHDSNAGGAGGHGDDAAAEEGGGGSSGGGAKRKKEKGPRGQR